MSTKTNEKYDSIQKKIKDIKDSTSDKGTQYRGLIEYARGEDNVEHKIYIVEEAIKLIPEALDAYYVMMVWELFTGGNFNRGYSYGIRVSPERSSL
jgi:hypothetical protein